MQVMTKKILKLLFVVFIFASFILNNNCSSADASEKTNTKKYLVRIIYSDNWNDSLGLITQEQGQKLLNLNEIQKVEEIASYPFLNQVVYTDQENYISWFDAFYVDTQNFFFLDNGFLTITNGRNFTEEELNEPHSWNKIPILIPDYVAKGKYLGPGSEIEMRNTVYDYREVNGDVNHIDMWPLANFHTIFEVIGTFEAKNIDVKNSNAKFLSYSYILPKSFATEKIEYFNRLMVEAGIQNENPEGFDFHINLINKWITVETNDIAEFSKTANEILGQSFEIWIKKMN